MAAYSKNVETDRQPQRSTLGRGRPALLENRQVSEDIIRAAEACLVGKSPRDISTKDIALAAGTRSAMIYYYFGSKDGLLAEIMRRHLDQILIDIVNLRDAIRRNEMQDPTRAMIGLLATSYNRRPALCRIMIAELLRDESPVRTFFLQQWPAHAKAMMVEAITQLSASGYYRQDLNIEGIVAMIRSVVFFPLMVKPYLMLEGEAVEQFLDESWLDLVCNVFDRYLRPKG